MRNCRCKVKTNLRIEFAEVAKIVENALLSLCSLSIVQLGAAPKLKQLNKSIGFGSSVPSSVRRRTTPDFFVLFGLEALERLTRRTQIRFGRPKFFQNLNFCKSVLKRQMFFFVSPTNVDTIIYCDIIKKYGKKALAQLGFRQVCSQRGVAQYDDFEGKRNAKITTENCFVFVFGSGTVG